MGRAEEERLAFEYSDGNNNMSNYYVQSPCSSSVMSISHANHGSFIMCTADSDHSSDHHLLLLPFHSHPVNNSNNINLPRELAQEDDEDEEEEDNMMNAKTKSASIHLSRCLSSRASVGDSFKLLSQKKKSMSSIPSKNMEISEGENEEGNEIDYGSKDGGWWQYLSIKTYPDSSLWIIIQLTWRLLFSLAAALLVFYIATKPPPPRLSLQVAGVKQFELDEGVDSSGVSTNFLSCNISMALVIDNKSQVFALVIPSPMLLDVYFGHLPILFSQKGAMRKDVGRIKAHERGRIHIEGGTTAKAMYGGGREMEDMLKSGKGLPLLLSLSFSSHYHYRLVGWLLRPAFRHRARCLLFLSYSNPNAKHSFPLHYNSTCSFLSSP